MHSFERALAHLLVSVAFCASGCSSSGSHPSDGADIAVALSGAGYHTAMTGKYLNGYLPKPNQADPGWTEWDVAGDGYRELNYQLNQNGMVVPYGSSPADYLVDVQSKLATQFIQQQG